MWNNRLGWVKRELGQGSGFPSLKCEVPFWPPGDTNRFSSPTSELHKCTRFGFNQKYSGIASSLFNNISFFSSASRLIPFWLQTWFSVQWRELAWHESHFRLSGRGTSRWLIFLISYASWAMSVPNVKSCSPTIRWQKQKKLHEPHFLSRSRESMWSPFLLLAFVFSALVNAAPKEVFIGPEKLIEEESAATTCQTAILRFLSYSCYHGLYSTLSPRSTGGMIWFAGVAPPILPPQMQHGGECSLTVKSGCLMEPHFWWQVFWEE